MNTNLMIFLVFVAAFLGYYVWIGMRSQRRKQFIANYSLPAGLIEKLDSHYPHLDENQKDTVRQGLNQFFVSYMMGGYKQVAMPSQAVDKLWHEFILYTQEYSTFCKKAFGRFLHHTPAAVLEKGARVSNSGLRRVWTKSCEQEGIDPHKPTRLPLLFALDTDLKIADGFRYDLDCEKLTREEKAAGAAYGGQTHCVAHFSDSSYDGSTHGLGEGASSKSGGDGSTVGCSSGCGGGGD